MWEYDLLKTTFIMDKGVFCYKVMLLGLKNAGATYQRIMNKVFKKHIRRNLEVYINNMLIKSRNLDNYLVHLMEKFSIMKQKKPRSTSLNVHLR